MFNRDLFLKVSILWRVRSTDSGSDYSDGPVAELEGGPHGRGINASGKARDHRMPVLGNEWYDLSDESLRTLRRIARAHHCHRALVGGVEMTSPE